MRQLIFKDFRFYWAENNLLLFWAQNSFHCAFDNKMRTQSRKDLFFFFFLEERFFSHTMYPNHCFPFLHSTYLLTPKPSSICTPPLVPFQKEETPQKRTTKRINKIQKDKTEALKYRLDKATQREKLSLEEAKSSELHCSQGEESHNNTKLTPIT